MRFLALLLSILFCASYAQAYQFIFKNGKTIQGSIVYEDASIYRILDISNVQMRIRKSELNVSATQAANVIAEEPPAEAAMQQMQEPSPRTESRPIRVYSNVDVNGVNPIASAPADTRSEKAWRSHIGKLEREFARLQGECRAAGGGSSKIWRSETYQVNGKSVRVNGYWADPTNIEGAKNICRRALQTEKALTDARIQFSEFQTSSGGR